MSNQTVAGLCDNKFSCKKGVCNQCGVCWYCDAPQYCQSKIKHKHFGTHIQSEDEQDKIKLNRTKIYHGRDIMNLTYELYLCDNGNVLSNKDKLLEIGKLLGVEAKTCNEIPNKGWNISES